MSNQLKIELDPKLHKWFKILCIHQEVQMKDICHQLIEKWVKETADKVGMKIDLD